MISHGQPLVSHGQPLVRSYKDDLKIGLDAEIEILPILNECFDDEFIQCSQYAPLDYEGSKCWIELKKRVGISYKTFPSMMIPMSKIDIAATKDKPVYFVFVLVDGIYYSRFDKNKYSLYGNAFWCRQDRLDHKDTPQRYCFIPTKDLDWLVI